MKMKIGTSIRFILYLIIYLVTAISARIIASTHVYDPGWVTVISFLFIGIPFFIGGIVVMAILLRKKVRWYIEIISVIIILILMISTYSILIHRNGLPVSPWEYSGEFSELYKSSRHFFGRYNDFRVYLGENITDGREAVIYGYIRGFDEWESIDIGIVKDSKLFIDNYRVYPTRYVGISHFGNNPIGSGEVIYIDHLTDLAESYSLYLKDYSDNLLNNLSNVTIGDRLAVFGEWEKGPVGDCEDCDYLIIDKIEVVETLK
jgi:hypothetical protein